MKRHFTSCPVVASALLSFGLVLSGCSPRAVRPDPLLAAAGQKTETIEMEELLIKVSKNAAADEDGFEIYDAPSLFREADALFDAEKFAEAAHTYEKVAIDFGESAWAPPALFNAALSLEVLGQFADAAARYKRVTTAYPSSKSAKEANLRQAACFAELGEWVRSAESLGQLEARDDLNLAERLETISRHGLALFELKDFSGAEAKFQKTLALRQTHSEETLPNSFFVAMSQFYAAHIAHHRFRDLPLRLPQKQLALDVDSKAKAFLLANTRYVDTIKLKNPTWATAAGFHVGMLYRELHDAMLGAPVPKELEKSDTRVLYDLLLRDKLRGLLASAKNVLESNVKMAERTGIKNGWVERSNEQLGELDKLLSGIDDLSPRAPGKTPQTPLRPTPPNEKTRATL